MSTKHILFSTLSAEKSTLHREKERKRRINSLIARLRDEKNIGLLPNDFAPVLLNAHPEYELLFDLFKSTGAFGWGITGSGSAAFTLFQKM